MESLGQRPAATVEGARKPVGLVAAGLALTLASACTSDSGMSPKDGGAGGASTGGSSGSASGGTQGGTSGGASGTASGGTQGGASGGTTGSASGGAPVPGSGGAAGAASGSGGVTSGGGRGSSATGGASGSGGSAGAAGGRSGSGGAAGAAGGGGPGGASDFGIGGPSRCSAAGVALCESFEDGLSSSTWTTMKAGDSMLAVDSGRAARGSKALHFKTTAGDFAYITETETFPATNNTLYGRMFVWFEDDITTTGHFSLAEGGGGTETEARFGGQFQVFGVGNDGGPSGDWTDADDRKKVIPSKTWICAEFELKGDTNEFRVWWDDQPRTALSTGATKHQGYVMPTFKSLWFGWWMYNMKEPQEIWIDEIAVDFKPIGCAK